MYSDYFSKIIKGVDSYDLNKDIFQKSTSIDQRDSGLFSDLTSYLPEDLLVKVDIASMANSLEGRSPILDQKMVALACQIPFVLKVRGKETKYIFKKALEKIVPKENLYRPKKGFSVPLDKWFTGKLNNYANSKLLRKKANTRQLFNQKEIKRMLKSHTVENDFGQQLWPLLTLELWFESYFG